MTLLGVGGSGSPQNPLDLLLFCISSKHLSNYNYFRPGPNGQSDLDGASGVSLIFHKGYFDNGGFYAHVLNSEDH